MVAHQKGWLVEACEHMEWQGGGFNPEKPGILYYLRIEHPDYPTLWKVGVTNDTIEWRFRQDMKYITALNEEYFSIGKYAYEKEQQILKAYYDARVCRGEKPLSREGNTELFYEDILGLDAE